MELKLHKLARTTPRIRQEIQASNEPVRVLAARYNVNESTIRRWKDRSSVADRSHRPHTRNTVMNEAEEQLIVHMRQDLQLSLDDMTEVVQRCVNPKISRSAIHRCLQRYGISKAPRPDKVKAGRFEEERCGYIHIDVKHLPKLDGKKSYVYVAIDRATRYVYAEILYDLKPTTAAAFLQRFVEHFPHPIHTILTDNGFEFTDKMNGKNHWAVSKGASVEVAYQPSGKHPVDKVCQQHGIKHKLTKPFKPQTNGMVERFNRRLNEAIAKKPRVHTNQGKNAFLNHPERNAYILNVVHNYNRTRLKVLNYQAPCQTLANLTEDYTCAGMTMLADYLQEMLAMQHSRIKPGCFFSN